MKHFLDIDDLEAEELAQILDLSPAEPKDIAPVLKGKGVALLFEKSSLRTRHSMEMAVNHLGGSPISVIGSEIGMGERESIYDIAKTLGCYHFAIGARVFKHQTLLDLAKASPVPIFNLLSDLGHPFQALADLLTAKQIFGDLEGLKLAYVGDANNVARSLALAAARAKMSFHIAHPEGYGFLSENFKGDPPAYAATHDPAEAVREADIVYTDVWTSMGQEEEAKKRRKVFQDYCVTADLMKLSKPSAIFLHCLPAHRGQEVTEEVIDGAQSRVWQQARNRMLTAMGYFLWLEER